MSGEPKPTGVAITSTGGKILQSPTRLTSSVNTPVGGHAGGSGGRVSGQSSSSVLGSSGGSSNSSGGGILSPSSSTQQLVCSTPPRPPKSVGASTIATTSGGTKPVRSSLSNSTEKRPSSAPSSANSKTGHLAFTTGNKSARTTGVSGNHGYAKKTASSVGSVASKRSAHAKPRLGAGTSASGNSSALSGSQDADTQEDGETVTASLLCLTPTRNNKGANAGSNANHTTPTRPRDRYELRTYVSASQPAATASAAQSNSGKTMAAWNDCTNPTVAGTNTTSAASVAVTPSGATATTATAAAAAGSSASTATTATNAAATVTTGGSRRVGAGSSAKSCIPVVRKNHPYLRQQQLQQLLHGSSSAPNATASTPSRTNVNANANATNNTTYTSTSTSVSSGGVGSSPNKAKRASERAADNTKGTSSGSRRISSNTSTTITTLLQGTKRSSGSVSKTNKSAASGSTSAVSSSSSATATSTGTVSVSNRSKPSTAVTMGAAGASTGISTVAASKRRAQNYTATTSAATTHSVHTSTPTRTGHGHGHSAVAPTRGNVPPVVSKANKTAAARPTSISTTNASGAARMAPAVAASTSPSAHTSTFAVVAAVNSSTPTVEPTSASAPAEREGARTPSAFNASPAFYLTTSPSSAFSVSRRSLANTVTPSNTIVPIPIALSGAIAKSNEGAEEVALNIPVARRVVRAQSGVPTGVSSDGLAYTNTNTNTNYGDFVGADEYVCTEELPIREGDEGVSRERQNSCSSVGSIECPLSPQSSTMQRCRAISDLNLSMNNDDSPVVSLVRAFGSSSTLHTGTGSPRVVPLSPRSTHMKGNTSHVNLTASILPVREEESASNANDSGSGSAASILPVREEESASNDSASILPVREEESASNAASILPVREEESASNANDSGSGSGVLAGRIWGRPSTDAEAQDQDQEIGYCLSHSTSNSTNDMPSSRPESVASTNFTANSSMLSAIYPNTEDGEEGSYGFFDGNNMSMSPRSLLTTPQSVLGGLCGPQSSASTISGSRMSPLTCSSIPNTASMNNHGMGSQIARFSPLPLQHSIVDAFQRQFSDNDMAGSINGASIEGSLENSRAVDVTVRLNDMGAGSNNGVCASGVRREHSMVGSAVSPAPSEASSVNPNNVAVIYYDGDSEAASLQGDSEMGAFFMQESEPGSRSRSVLQSDSEHEYQEQVDSESYSDNFSQSGIEVSTSLGEISSILPMLSSISTVYNGANLSSISGASAFPSVTSMAQYRDGSQSQSQFTLGSSCYDSTSGDTTANDNNITMVSRTISAEADSDSTASCGNGSVYNTTHLLSITTCNDNGSSSSQPQSVDTSGNQLFNIGALSPRYNTGTGAGTMIDNHSTDNSSSSSSDTKMNTNVNTNNTSSSIEVFGLDDSDSTNAPLSPMGSISISINDSISHPHSISVTREDSDPLAGSLEYVQH